jgi:nicotinate-nucleotide--dimethylbenzimidazole phosphoribosyltransferase
MKLLLETCAAIRPVSHDAARHVQKLLDEKTKPRGSLGVLESLACRLAAIADWTTPPRLTKAIVVMAGDHGVANEGVSAYPSEVTAQMLLNFANGGAAINVLARHADARVVVVNMGTKDGKVTSWQGDKVTNYEMSPDHPVTLSPRHLVTPSPGHLVTLSSPLGPGTANFAHGPAMTLDQALRGIEIGIQIANDLCTDGTGLIGVGEMGIGNTTSASALTAVFTGHPPEQVTGRGTGIDDAAWKHKIAVIHKALAVNQPDPSQPLEALSKVGGFELAGLVGVMLGAAVRRVPILLDGFITGAAALAAVALCPALRDYLIASHQSVEPGHRRILEYLELRPLLNLDLRLGEGTGAALAMHLVEASLRIVREMATFTSAGVSSTGA